MPVLIHTLLFEVGDRRLALPVSVVEQITAMVEIEPIPGAPDVVDGVVDVHGRLAPVYGLRRRFAVAHRDPDVWEHLIIAWAGARLVAVRADRVLDVAALPVDAFEPLEHVTTAAPGIGGLARTADGVLLVHDPTVFLTTPEADALDIALDRARAERSGQAPEEHD